MNVTDNCAEPPVAGNDTAWGMIGVHGVVVAAPAACVKLMSVVPPVSLTMMRPKRCAAPAFAATVYAIVPLVVPLNPDVIVIHGWLACAAHPQLVPATVTADCPLAPAPGTLTADGTIDDTHGVELGCVTISCALEPPPDTVIRPVRGDPDEFGATA